MNTENLDDKFKWFATFLICFNSNVYVPNVKDKVVIADFVAKYQGADIQQTIDEGKKLLEIPIENFPNIWVRNITQNFPKCSEYKFG